MGDIVWQKAKFMRLVYVSAVGQVFSPQMEFSARVVEMRVLIAVLNAVSEELVRRSLNGSLWMTPFLTLGGWQLEKCVY